MDRWRPKIKAAIKTALTAKEGFPIAKTLDDGSGWTFGRAGALRNRVHAIRVDKLKA